MKTFLFSAKSVQNKHSHWIATFAILLALNGEQEAYATLACLTPEQAARQESIGHGSRCDRAPSSSTLTGCSAPNLIYSCPVGAPLPSQAVTRPPRPSSLQRQQAAQPAQPAAPALVDQFTASTGPTFCRDSGNVVVEFTSTSGRRGWACAVSGSPVALAELNRLAQGGAPVDTQSATQISASEAATAMRGRLAREAAIASGLQPAQRTPSRRGAAAGRHEREAAARALTEGGINHEAIDRALDASTPEGSSLAGEQIACGGTATPSRPRAACTANRSNFTQDRELQNFKRELNTFLMFLSHEERRSRPVLNDSTTEAQRFAANARGEYIRSEIEKMRSKLANVTAILNGPPNEDISQNLSRILDDSFCPILDFSMLDNNDAPNEQDAHNRRMAALDRKDMKRICTSAQLRNLRRGITGYCQNREAVAALQHAVGNTSRVGTAPQNPEDPQCVNPTAATAPRAPATSPGASDVTAPSTATGAQ